MDSRIETFVSILQDNELVYRKQETTHSEEGFTYYDPDSGNPVHVKYPPKKKTPKGGKYTILEFIEMADGKTLSMHSGDLFLLNGIPNPQDLEQYLFKAFDDFKSAFSASALMKNEIDVGGVTSKIMDARMELENLLLKTKRINALYYNMLIKTKIEYCVESLRFIKSPIELAIIQNSPNVKEGKSKKPKKSLDHLTKLSQNQIVILFHYLREQEIVGKEMPNTDYAEPITGLTGFSNEGIRKDLSNIIKADSEYIKLKAQDYSKVWRELDEVIKKIKAESARKFPE